MQNIFEIAQKVVRENSYRDKIESMSAGAIRLAAHGLLSLGKLKDAQIMLGWIEEEAPQGLLLKCAQEAKRKKEYRVALDVFLMIGDLHQLREFGTFCFQKQNYAIALKAFAKLGDVERLISIGQICMEASHPDSYLVALDAFTACEDSFKLLELGDAAATTWRSNPQPSDDNELTRCGLIAMNAYLRAGSKGKVVALGWEAFHAKDYDLMLHCFSEANDRIALSDAGKQFLQMGDLEHAKKCLYLAGDEEGLFQWAVAAFNEMRPRDVLRELFSSDRTQAFFDRFVEQAHNFLRSGKDEMAWEMYEEIVRFQNA